MAGPQAADGEEVFDPHGTVFISILYLVVFLAVWVSAYLFILLDGFRMQAGGG